MRVGRRRKGSCGPLGIACDDDVEVLYRVWPVEEGITHGPADQPCPLARQCRARNLNGG